MGSVSCYRENRMKVHFVKSEKWGAKTVERFNLIFRKRFLLSFIIRIKRRSERIQELYDEKMTTRNDE